MSILYPELSYKVRGLLFTVCNSYGLDLREKIYQKAFAELLSEESIVFEREKRVDIFSVNNGRKIGLYIPDFVIEDKVIVELKAEPFIHKRSIAQAYSYLRISKYELAFIVNFGGEKLEIKRLLFTNDRKPHLIRIR